jgi:hypothetical protein
LTDFREDSSFLTLKFAKRTGSVVSVLFNPRILQRKSKSMILVPRKIEKT